MSQTVCVMTIIESTEGANTISGNSGFPQFKCSGCDVIPHGRSKSEECESQWEEATSRQDLGGGVGGGLEFFPQVLLLGIGHSPSLRTTCLSATQPRSHQLPSYLNTVHITLISSSYPTQPLSVGRLVGNFQKEENTFFPHKRQLLTLATQRRKRGRRRI